VKEQLLPAKEGWGDMSAEADLLVIAQHIEDDDSSGRGWWKDSGGTAAGQRMQCVWNGRTAGVSSSAKEQSRILLCISWISCANDERVCEKGNTGTDKYIFNLQLMAFRPRY
jgi:hypothetical protein